MHIDQFYGIEIDGFAVSVAQTALWIAESQMMFETEQILHRKIDFLPLKRYAHIVKGNALRMDWNGLLQGGGFIEPALPGAEGRAASTRPPHFSYILGNPPFIGARNKSSEQAADVEEVFKGWKNAGNLDYVTCWYKKASDLMRGTSTTAAFVSTNSICQGESAALLWKPLFAEGVEIDFAWRTFVWDSEANEKAHVHVVIVGFSVNAEGRQKNAPLPFRSASRNPTDTKWLFDDDGTKTPARHINGYLTDGPDVFVESVAHPLCAVPTMGIGNKPIDGGNYLFTEDARDAFLEKEPRAAAYFRTWLGTEEFINGKKRYCLWLGDASPAELRSMPECLKRVQAVYDFRMASKSEGTRKIADKPTRFHVENFPKGNYLLVPKVSSERRRYVPMGFLSPDVFSSDLVMIVPDATLYHFGVLTSSVHMAWMRAVAGRLKSDYRYSAAIVYNNFPWPRDLARNVDSSLRSVSGASDESELFKTKIERTAQAILDARALYPDSSLADLYDPLTMPPELRKVHATNDAAVMEAYGFAKTMTEAEIVAELFKRYAELAHCLVKGNG